MAVFLLGRPWFHRPGLRHALLCIGDPPAARLALLNILIALPASVKDTSSNRSTGGNLEAGFTALHAEEAYGRVKSRYLA